MGLIRTQFSGDQADKSLMERMQELGVAVLEDALAIGGGILVSALAAPGYVTVVVSDFLNNTG
jgi:uncharacterized membrane protein